MTDFAEELFVTDPNNRDTDGDGLDDGVDPLPLVASSGQPRREAEIVAPILKERPRAPA